MNDLTKIWVWLTTGLLGDLLRPILTFVIGYVAIRFALKFLKTLLEKSKLEAAAHNLVISVVRTVLYILLILAILSGMGVDVTGVVALASVLTLAVSLALQNMLSNVVGGFTIIYNHPFRAGDFVEVAGQAGTVQEITMAYTRLLTPDNKTISIPNSAVVASQISNFTSAGTRRVDIAVSASYDEDSQKVVDALVQAGTVDKVLLDPAPFAAVDTYGESTIHYTLRVWAKAEDYWDVYFLVTKRVKDIFDEHGVRMSYPHLNVHLDK